MGSDASSMASVSGHSCRIYMIFNPTFLLNLFTEPLYLAIGMFLFRACHHERLYGGYVGWYLNVRKKIRLYSKTEVPR
jgi:prolipoprotein diacylglyceryltransferase